MSKKQQLENMAKEFDTSKDFDAVMAHYDVEEILPWLAGSNILEMGTSAGTVTQHLIPLADVLDIVEGSITGIERTKKNITDPDDKVRYRYSLWEEFRPDKEYSDIVFVRGLEHVEEPVKLLSKTKGWLNQSGRIHIIVPNALSLHRRVMQAQGKLQDLYSLRERDRLVGHQRVYDSTHLTQQVSEAGYDIVHNSGFFVKSVSTSQMGNITMDPHHPLIKTCYEAGKIFPNIGTQLYVVGEKQ